MGDCFVTVFLATTGKYSNGRAKYLLCGALGLAPWTLVAESSRGRDAAVAIRDMLVRGAPLIGATAAWGLALAVREDPSDAALELAQVLVRVDREIALDGGQRFDEGPSLRRRRDGHARPVAVLKDGLGPGAQRQHRTWRHPPAALQRQPRARRACRAGPPA